MWQKPVMPHMRKKIGASRPICWARSGPDSEQLVSRPQPRPVMTLTSRTASILVLTTCLLGPVAVQAQRPVPLRVGPVTARAGEKVSGFLEIPPGVDSGTRVPITVIQGRASGPTLALVAGTHGSEVAPIIALQRVRAALDPAQLRGTVVLVHVANMPSYLKRTVFYTPIDRTNLN